ncbi:hypothetical protein [Spirosoma montaniterrae]|uniref:Uncharacterized protein n=1 Tax=Spirosoma montaniterrae TaxID=1178516 RepID=A0A1P9WRL3_9BACT|nr:hypothetical protein [Spirosoma montaniterrae]AQG78012.1 hypothetical protein AWR27_00780 [Spirosoma montaniterrae]
MQGLSVINDPQGNPKILTLDLQQHDQQLNPLVDTLLNLIRGQQEEAEERAEWRLFSHAALNRAYGEDEPDYDDVPALELSKNHE